MGSRLALARDYLTLTAAIALLLIPVWTCTLHLDATSASAAGGLAGSAATLAALGLFMTWGDEGSRLRNAARTLAALLALCLAVVLLLVWNASTAPPPE